MEHTRQDAGSSPDSLELVAVRSWLNILAKSRRAGFHDDSVVPSIVAASPVHACMVR